ncbi:MAG TPA: hypothetical protein VJY39_02095 [Acidisphaera sp.]|nr:hypothetical protein [Acidisphaera sp.]
MCATPSRADNVGSIVSPLGVYVKVDIEDAISAIRRGYTGDLEPTPKYVHVLLQKLYQRVLANPAVSGITIGVHWANVQPHDPLAVSDNSDGYDWSYLDDAFGVANWVQKSVQLIVTPGFDSPQWLLSRIPSCDGLFNPATRAAVAEDCGTVTFAEFPDKPRAEHDADGRTVLPLSWNGVYQKAWAAFLQNLNVRYGNNPAFVAIAVAGPVGASADMVLPATSNQSLQQPGLEADNAWVAQIRHAFPRQGGEYAETDQVFVDQWKQTIDTYESIFQGVTLVLSPGAGAGLPEFRMNHTQPAIASSPPWAKEDCEDATDLRSCEAKVAVLSYFAAVAGNNAKATQVGGMTASSPRAFGDIGIAGVKLLAVPPASSALFGGAAFAQPVSGKNKEEEGCPTLTSKPRVSCLDLTPEEAAYNVLSVFFYGTPVARHYGGQIGPAPAPIQYLDVPYEDVDYARTTPCPPRASVMLYKKSLQDLLNSASHDLSEMAGQQAPLPPPTCTE